VSESILGEPQNGFRKGPPCIDFIFVINQVNDKHREFNLPTLTAFLDYEKAFDKVIMKNL
jgi:hypothetical protein